MTIDVSSTGTKFEIFVQAGCRDLGSHRGGTMYCQKPIILPNMVLFFGTFLELPILPSIVCGVGFTPQRSGFDTRLVTCNPGL